MVKPLGRLEQRVMEVLWRASPLTVREVASRLGEERAYTTVMTTLDRLFRKELLARDKVGNAFAYRAAMTRDGFHQQLVEQAVGALLQASADPVLAAFVDTAARIDEANLRRLERLIAERRRSKKR